MSALEPVSVVICAFTMDRWSLLEAAVVSALRQPETAEVVIVIDHNKELLARARERWPLAIVVPNAHRAGLSGARNTGIAASSTGIVAFLDDDASGTDTWLHWLIAPFSGENVAAVGGRAEPVWPSAAEPRILPRELQWVVGCSYAGLPESRSEVRNVIGCSMAFRREILLELGGFNIDTGRVGSLPLGCEETELCIRLRQADVSAQVIYEPRSVVHHTVTAERVRWTYLVRRCFFEGMSKAALTRTLGRGDALSSETSYALKVLPQAFFRELVRSGRGGARPAAAIVLSLAFTAAGFLFGRVAPRTQEPVQPSSVSMAGELS